MNFSSEKELVEFGERLGREILQRIKQDGKSRVIELIGDVGAGKTTLTRGIAKGLGVEEAVTSPSFTISKRYVFPLDDSKADDSLLDGSQLDGYLPGDSSFDDSMLSDGDGVLSHFDFYRLGEPGLMTEDLAESIAEERSVTIVEWGETVDDVLGDREIYKIEINDDGTRTVKMVVRTEKVEKVVDGAGKEAYGHEISAVEKVR